MKGYSPLASFFLVVLSNLRKRVKKETSFVACVVSLIVGKRLAVQLERRVERIRRTVVSGARNCVKVGVLNAVIDAEEKQPRFDFRNQGTSSDSSGFALN